jgi:hypothetical protein
MFFSFEERNSVGDNLENVSHFIGWAFEIEQGFLNFLVGTKLGKPFLYAFLVFLPWHLVSLRRWAFAGLFGSVNDSSSALYLQLAFISVRACVRLRR